MNKLMLNLNEQKYLNEENQNPLAFIYNKYSLNEKLILTKNKDQKKYNLYLKDKENPLQVVGSGYNNINEAEKNGIHYFCKNNEYIYTNERVSFNELTDLQKNTVLHEYLKYNDDENLDRNYFRDYLLLDNQKEDYSNKFYQKLFEKIEYPETNIDIINSILIKNEAKQWKKFEDLSFVKIIKETQNQLNNKLLETIQTENRINKVENRMNHFFSQIKKLLNTNENFKEKIILKKLFNGLNPEQKKEVIKAAEIKSNEFKLIIEKERQKEIEKKYVNQIKHSRGR